MYNSANILYAYALPVPIATNVSIFAVLAFITAVNPLVKNCEPAIIIIDANINCIDAEVKMFQPGIGNLIIWPIAKYSNGKPKTTDIVTRILNELISFSRASFSASL